MQQHAKHLKDRVHKRLNEAIEDATRNVMSGALDPESYKYQVGYVDGIKDVLALIDAEYDKITRDDFEEDEGEDYE